jgi:hypothetical protein
MPGETPFFAEYSLTRERPKLFIQCSNPEQARWLSDNSATSLAVLSSAESAQLLTPQEAASRSNCATSIVNETTSILMELSGSLLDKELKRLRDKQVSISRLHLRNLTWHGAYMPFLPTFAQLA